MALKVRKASGYIAGYLSHAIATVNGTYFQRGPENQIEVKVQAQEVFEFLYL
jgi:hypothetical protein